MRNVGKTNLKPNYEKFAKQVFVSYLKTLISRRQALSKPRFKKCAIDLALIN